MTKKKVKKKSVKNHKPAKPVRVDFQTKRKPGFETALDEVITETNQGKSEEATRPGPGGQDQVPGAPDNLDKAAKALAPVLKIPFSIWAKVSEIPEMKLTDAEAEEWAEPIVALLEYYFPGKIPEIAWMWLMFLSATEKVIDSRVKIRYEKRKERTLYPGSAPREPAANSPQPAPKHNGAEPATEYPKE